MYTLFKYIELEARKTGSVLELTDGGRLSFSLIGYIAHKQNKTKQNKTKHRGGVAQWVGRLTRDRWILVSREFEPHQRPPLFP